MGARRYGISLECLTFYKLYLTRIIFFIGCSLNINVMAATSASFASTKETTN